MWVHRYNLNILNAWKEAFNPYNSSMWIFPYFNFQTEFRLASIGHYRSDWYIYVTNNHGYVPFVVNTFWFYPHLWLITRFVTRLTRSATYVHPRFWVGFVLLSIFSFMCMLCRSLFVLFVFSWPLCCVSFDLLIMITPLVSSSSSSRRLPTYCSHRLPKK